MNTNTSVQKIRKLFEEIIMSNEQLKVEYRNGSFTGNHIELTTIANNKYYREELEISNSVYELLTNDMLTVMIGTFVKNFRKRSLE